MKCWISLFFCTIALTVLPASVHAEEIDKANCTFKGKPLYGKVQIVDVFPDITVQVVDVFPDLKVQKVDVFPDACGKWQKVDVFPDFTIKFVDVFPDVKVQYVDVFPGI